MIERGSEREVEEGWRERGDGRVEGRREGEGERRGGKGEEGRERRDKRETKRMMVRERMSPVRPGQ